MSKDKQTQPYLLRGLQSLTTDSSTLISSSHYLNDPRLRDWISTHFLRRSGKDRPTSADAYQLYAFLFDLQDLERIETLFTDERAGNPALDSWFNEGFISNFTKEDLLDCPAGSLGRIFGDYLHNNGFELDIVERFEPRTQYDYYRFRSGQTHDLEHIMFGGAFNILGELVPYYARLTNVPKFLNPELAGHVNLGQQLGAQRVIMRTALHYPQSYLTALEATRAGMEVGLNSDPIFLIAYEDVLHLPVEEARQIKGIRNAREVDTHAASLEWDEYRPD